MEGGAPTLLTVENTADTVEKPFCSLGFLLASSLASP